ncbi:Cell division protein FtsI/penicillin-binding protein 2 [Quadrisphaera granulorum]|uniref:Cell division protein FtsI/penicillin-binding protein 2 n=1 Tax=Quadrisphaera granulorum TaxID=317664 RepID=A0A316AC78_9ACTN|nr:penicillin-binding transpeptidase domain-containing protein [Quadrisphaera granulorum]PWJ55335.1 cell division protein FtsI/penicillin-binding protein 2 [Quadrisphaera granulorum]SZE95399.1 Cell division protein FtsI/penicillin-binding protein 2 [Quadrisphaera granulorum]
MLVASGVAVALLTAGVATFVVWQGRERDDAARTAAQALADGLAAGDLSRATLVDSAGTPAPDAAKQYAALVAGMDGLKPRVEVSAVDAGADQPSAQFAVSWDVGAGWSYTTSARLAPVAEGAGGDDDGDGAWGAVFTPAVVEPSLKAGERLAVQRTPAARGQVLGRDGQPIVADSPVVEVGVQPSRTTDPAGLAAQLAGIVDVDGDALAQRIRSAAPTAFVPVITLRRADYDAVKAQLQPLPGTVFRESTLPLAPTPAFARALLGRVGQATKEIVDASDGRIASGDTTGLSGLQRTYDERLAGTPGTTVQALPATNGADGASASASTRASSGDAAAAAEPRALFTSDPVAGQSVRLSLDAGVQQAADAALATAKSKDAQPAAALVVVDIPSGDLLAVANTPTTGADRALDGQYPPGSTFKAVSTTALLATGLTPQDTVACPPTATVNGRSFQNFEGEALGNVPFATDFAQSCNTAFVGLSSRLGAQDLPTAAAAVGLGGDWDAGLGMKAFTGSVPADDDAVARAAASIGQGTVLASPAAMAVAASTIARGSWTAPHLVLDPAPAASTSAAPQPDAARLAVVRDLMRQVVTSGTAKALADVPGAPVSAKTGTAEFGSGNPLPTHAWVIGFRGDLAFAVLAENGTSGATTAVPVAESLLRALPSS